MRFGSVRSAPIGTVRLMVRTTARIPLDKLAPRNAVSICRSRPDGVAADIGRYGMRAYVSLAAIALALGVAPAAQAACSGCRAEQVTAANAAEGLFCGS